MEKGCEIQDYAKRFGLGFVAGAVTGGVGVGITARSVGIGDVASQALASSNGCDLDLKDRQKWTEYTVKATYNQPEQSRGRIKESTKSYNVPVIPVTSARFSFISKGLLQSKMIIEYNEKGSKQKEKTTKSWNAIEILLDPEDVKYILKWCNLSVHGAT
ncbi:unnamed protein product [Mytilus coruscus]|uniref:Uncharacterized protein n=1 Tax=Mytilus coruscus TaxID=42192 RepID=A0A6J8DRV0_MYTCO|nr:unnamed protein product [Mytilus coruscus]